LVVCATAKGKILMSRCYISGLNDEGQSIILREEEIGNSPSTVESWGPLAWRTAVVPADNNASLDPSLVLNMDLIHSSASCFFLVRTPPGSRSEMHATDTIDYITMISGTLIFGVETGEITLSQGDLLVDRGVLHYWYNDGTESSLHSVVTLPAHPVGPRAQL
jgi:hypothetical protein